MNLLMREREIARDNFEKGRLEGMEEGKVEGIRKLCESLKGLGIEGEVIRNELIKRYNLSEEEIGKYLNG